MEAAKDLMESDQGAYCVAVQTGAELFYDTFSLG
jgi:hypothetical protein